MKGIAEDGWTDSFFACKDSGLPIDECRCTRCRPDTFRFKWICEEAKTIGDVINTVGAVREHFKGLQEKGYFIDGPIPDDYMEIHPPKRPGYYSIRCQECGEIFYVHHGAVSPGMCDECDLKEDSETSQEKTCVCKMDLEELEKLAQKDIPDSEVLFELGHRLVRADDISRAREVFSRLVELQPENPKPLLYLGHVLSELDEHEDAVHHLKRAITMDPDSAELWKYLGMNLWILHKLREAESTLRKSLSLDESDEWTWSFLGDVLKETELTSDAEECYIRSVMIEATHFYGWYELGQVLIEQGKFSKADNALMQACRLRPTHDGVLLELARAKLELEEYKEAEGILRELVTRHPDKDEGWYLLGELLFWNERYEEAEEALSNAIHNDGDYYDAWISLGRLYSETGRDDMAVGAFQKAISLRPYHELPHMELKRVYGRLGWEEELKAESKVLTDLKKKLAVLLHTIPYNEIDTSIRDIIRELNELGLETWGSCSGLVDDHSDRELSSPYVNFFTETPEQIQTIFRIADEAGWHSDYGVNGDGAYMQLEGSSEKEIKERWDRLIETARGIMQKKNKGEDMKDDK